MCAQRNGFDRIGCCWNNTLPLCPNDVQLPDLITQLELRAQIFVHICIYFLPSFSKHIKIHRFKISIGCITIFMGTGVTPLFMRLCFLFYYFNPTEGHWLCWDGVRWQVSLHGFWHGCVASSNALWTFFINKWKASVFFLCFFFPYYNCLSIFHCVKKKNVTKQRIWFGQTSWSWNKSS